MSLGMSGILGALGFIGVGYTAVAGIKEVTTAFMDFQQQMAGVHATLGEVTDKDLTKLGNKAIEISNKYGIASLDIAAGAENLASAGFDAKQVMDSLEASTLLSVAGNIKMQESTLDIAAAIRNFNMETSQAAHVADIYAKAAADTSAAMPDMAFAMKYIAPVANQAGWSIESTAAAVLANAGIKSTSAGTGLRRMFTRLINPTDKAAEKMKELGFEAIDPTTHKIKDIGTLIQDLQGSMKGLDSASKGAALSLIFGVEGLTPMSALMNSSKDEIDKLTKSFQDSDGAAQKMADTMNDTVAGSLGLFKTNIENAFITDIDKTPLGKSLRKFIDDLNKNLPEITNNGKCRR
jgi:TP901 family phage tail tape measure protein